MQQRSISPESLDILDAMGIEDLQKGGTHIQRLSRKELDHIIKKLKRVQRDIDQLARMYCVRTEQGVIITTGYQYKKLRTLS